jgi:hypothetical protein
MLQISQVAVFLPVFVNFPASKVYFCLLAHKFVVPNVFSTDSMHFPCHQCLA